MTATSRTRRAVAALVLVDQCRCLKCNHRWRESSLLIRNSDGSYSYEQTPETMAALAGGEIPITGRRLTTRSIGACHNCAPALKVTIWHGHLDFTEPHDTPVARTNPSRKARSSSDSATQQAKINSILDGL